MTNLTRENVIGLYRVVERALEIPEYAPQMKSIIENVGQLIKSYFRAQHDELIYNPLPEGSENAEALQERTDQILRLQFIEGINPLQFSSLEDLESFVDEEMGDRERSRKEIERFPGPSVWRMGYS